MEGVAGRVLTSRKKQRRAPLRLGESSLQEEVHGHLRTMIKTIKAERNRCKESTSSYSTEFDALCEKTRTALDPWMPQTVLEQVDQDADAFATEDDSAENAGDDTEGEPYDWKKFRSVVVKMQRQWRDWRRSIEDGRVDETEGSSLRLRSLANESVLSTGRPRDSASSAAIVTALHDAATTDVLTSTETAANRGSVDGSAVASDAIIALLEDAALEDA